MPWCACHTNASRATAAVGSMPWGGMHTTGRSPVRTPPHFRVSQFAAITLAGVHAALAYYYDHIEEIQQAMRAERLEEASRSVSTVFIRTNTSQPTSRLASGGAAST